MMSQIIIDWDLFDSDEDDGDDCYLDLFDSDKKSNNGDDCLCNLENGFRSFDCLMDNEECPKNKREKKNKVFHLD